MANLRVKSALVLGGVGGIGAEIIRSLCSNGLEKLAVIDIAKDPKSVLDKVCSSYVYKKAHVDDRSGLKTAMAEAAKDLGGLDIVINSAGVLNEQDPERMIAVNYGGVVNSTLIGVELMRQDQTGRGGVILNVSSTSALGSHFILPIYTGTKHAVLGFTKSLVHDSFYQKTGISFITLCPGITTTALLENFLDNFTFPEMRDEIGEIINKEFRQEPKIVGEAVVKALESVQNGAVWGCSHNKIMKIEVPEFPYRKNKGSITKV